MSFTFVSRRGGGADAGAIVLWYGIKADIPAGWEYYSAAADMLVMGATSANSTPVGTTTHTHTYSADTGSAGTHSHSFTRTVGSPNIGGSISSPGAITGKYWATTTHTNHNNTITGNSTDPDHIHDVLTTGSSANLPESFGLYYIKKV